MRRSSCRRSGVRSVIVIPLLHQLHADHEPGIVLLATQNRSQGGNLGLYVLVLHRLQSMRGELGHALEVKAYSFSTPLRPSPLHLSPQPLNLPKGAGSEVGLVCDKSCCTMLDSLGQPSQLLILLGRQAQPRRRPHLQRLADAFVAVSHCSPPDPIRSFPTS